MTTLVPTVFRESFERQIDRLFEEALSSLSGWASAWAPDCNIYEDDGTFCVQIAVPGMEPKDIDVQVKNDQLLVKGERKHEIPDHAAWYVREFKEGPFSCSFVLPTYVDREKATSSLKHGVLTIKFPKLEQAKPRHIMIESQ